MTKGCSHRAEFCWFQINTSDELVIVELLFSGAFSDLSPEMCATLLSCMTYDERVKDADGSRGGLSPLFVHPFQKLREVARAVVRTQIACNVQVEEDDYIQSLNPGM